MWKFWLGIAIFLGCVVVAQLDAHSPQTEARRAQLYQNAVSEVREEARTACNSDTSRAECERQADQAAQMARRKLKPALGQ